MIIPDLVKDEAIGKVLRNALNLSENHLEKIKEFFIKEELPIPVGSRSR
jgi:hypothetical protein